ncbi:MAG: TolC family protein [Planctomycetota bacterium]|jgi:outer membrane protein TolC
MKNVFFILPLTLFVISGCISVNQSLESDLADESDKLQIDNASDKNEAIYLGEKPQLDDYLAYALQKNPGLKASFYSWQAAVKRIGVIRHLPEPRVSYTNYIEEVETRTGPQKNSYMVKQMLPWPGKIFNKNNIAVREAYRQKYLYDAQKLQVFYLVKKNYYEYYYLKKSVGILSENLTLLKSIEKVKTSQYRTGSTGNPELLQLQIETERLADRIEGLKDMRSVFAARLNAAIGRKSTFPLPWPEGFEVMAVKLDEEKFIEVIAKHNPALKAIAEKTRSREYAKSLAVKSYLPDFGFGAAVIDTDRRSDVDVDENGKDPLLLTFEMSLPVWYGKYRRETAAAEAEYKKTEAEYEDRENRLLSDIRFAFYKYKDSVRKYNLFGKILIPKAEQAVKTAQSSFISGKFKFNDFIETVRSLLELQLLYEKAATDIQINIANLEQLAGPELIENLINKNNSKSALK